MKLEIDAGKSRIFNDLVEYTKLSPTLVIGRCKYAMVELAILWHKKKNILEYYTANDLFLYDLTSYQLKLEAMGSIKNMMEQIKLLKLSTVLEFGGGIGEFSLICKENGIDVTYFDLDGMLKDYATWRFNRHNLGIKISDKEPLEKRWDAVNIMDVLEHLEKPEITIEKLSWNARYIFCNPRQIRYNVFYPQHISRFDLTKDFEHVDGYLWKNKKLI
jgi:hypothetical protein